MHRHDSTLIGLLLQSMLVLCLLLALPAAAQDRDRNDDDRWSIPDDATSENNTMLERMLQTFPDADVNKDGILDATEGRRTRSIVLTDSDHVILSAITPETIATRLAPDFDGDLDQ